MENHLSNMDDNQGASLMENPHENLENRGSRSPEKGPGHPP